jgi:hypothetical protein
MASTLKRAGFRVRLDQIEDVFFEISDGIPCFMECKRVHSQRKLGERIDKASARFGDAVTILQTPELAELWLLMFRSC